MNVTYFQKIDACRKKPLRCQLHILLDLWEACRIKKDMETKLAEELKYFSRIFFMSTVGSLVISKEAEG
jgi:hypothetical protein